MSDFSTWGAINCNETTQTIIGNCLNNLSDNAHQREKNDLSKVPHDITFDKIPDYLATTKRNNQFLQYDSGPGNDRILIFSSLKQLRLLESSEELLVDGTFKVASFIFYQLYALHVVYRGTVIPVVFPLLTNKNQETYRRLSDKLIEICPLFNPKSVMIDFERATINAFNDIFTTRDPSFTMSGCFFHLQNSVQRKVQDLGFKTNCEQDPQFAHDANKPAALAFLNPNDVSQGMEDIYNSLPEMMHPL